MPSDNPTAADQVDRKRADGWLADLRRWLAGRRAAPRPVQEGEAPAAAATELVDHARAFSQLTVGDVMIPRVDILAIEIDASLEAVVSAFLESGHSRLPVYRRNLDDPVGVAHLKDVFRLLAGPETKPAARTRVLRGLMRETLYVPPSMPAAELLVRMRTGRIHMAMVIDEFGGLDGLVTLEDVIEAVVGEIDDEHDEASPVRLESKSDGIFEADGRVALEELEEALGAELASQDLEEEIDTVAGLVVALAGRVPRRGEVVSHPAGFDFEVIEADPRRIKRLLVRRSQPARGAAELTGGARQG
ncbi:MAG TPA: hemolysin family protein [Caulobacteraceae bacterium]|nr:hemolysin family protein [Caulobacteraceae bacterium]